MNRSILFLALMVTSAVAAEKLKVRIIDRRDSEQGYSYTLPQQVNTTSNTSVNCTAYPKLGGLYREDEHDWHHFASPPHRLLGSWCNFLAFAGRRQNRYRKL
jgi:hypothetical protein